MRIKTKMIGLLIIALFGFGLVMPMSVEAAAPSIHPSLVSLKISPGASEDVEFVVSGLDGTLLISSENLPITVTPSSVNVVQIGSNIKVTIKCNNVTPSVTQTGSIVFSPKGGSSQSSIRVRCRLSVSASGASSPISPSSSPPMIVPEKPPSSSVPSNPSPTAPIAPVVPSAPIVPISPIAPSVPTAPTSVKPLVTTPASPKPATEASSTNDVKTNQIIAEANAFFKSYGLWIAGIVVLSIVAASVYMIIRKKGKIKTKGKGNRVILG